MPRDLAAEAGGTIGPNAILQLLPVLEDDLGPAGCDALLARAGVVVRPEDGMIPAATAASLHREVRATLGTRAAGSLARAGRRTGCYILAHRIPRPVRGALSALPAPLAARLLSAAIARNAWTFAGSGRFRAVTASDFILADNPLTAGEAAPAPLCHWHAAVFETLYRRLVHPNATCRETACSADGSPACRFALRW